MASKNEIYVGLPFLKCSSNPSQTINAKTNKKSKTAVTKKIALEAFERFGNDPDINKDESNKNIYLTNIESTEEYLELIEKTKTLTKDKNGHVILGDETKTGRYKRLKGKKDIRYIPFALFDSAILTHIFENQIKIAKENKYNKNHLLFCQKDGQAISHIGINSIFKRICRESKIKLELDTGCHFHMTRHTAITRLIEMGTDPMVIASWVGHTNTRQIEETYGHILQNFKNWQLEHPGEYYKKEDLITKDVKQFLLHI